MRVAILVAAVLLAATSTGSAAPLRIVAIGASNTQGWYVGKQGAYPAKLQALLKARGIEATGIDPTTPLLDVVRDPFDRGRQAKIIEQRWAQVRGDATHRTDQGVDSRL